METKLKIHYNFDGQRYSLVLDASAAGLVCVKDGFWVAEDMSLGASGEWKYWIPPSQIVLVEVINVEE